MGVALATGLAVGWASVGDYATPVEVQSALLALDDLSWLRLKKAARHMTAGTSLAADELLDEAVRRLLETGDGKIGRRWRRDTAIDACLFMATKSVASEHRAKQRTATARLTVVEPENDASVPRDLIENATPETAMQEAEERKVFAGIRDQVYGIFADDPVCKEVLAGIALDMGPADIQMDLGLSETQYGTVRRKIRRRLDKAFPEGWRS